MNCRIKVIGIIILFVTVTTCKKDIESKNREFDPSVSEETIITVNTTEIGGSGLVLISSRDDNSPLINKTFNTVVSKEGTQLLAILDSKDKLRALTLSTPKLNTGISSSVDAHSTAITLVFITPGIIETDLNEAETVINSIETLSSFKPFEAFLKNKLVSSSINDIVGLNEYATLLTNCIDEYYLEHISVTKSDLKSGIGWRNWLSFSQISKNSIELKNNAYRFVSVYERDLNSNDEQIRLINLVPEMKGAVPFSWGSLFTGSAFDPTIEMIDYLPVPNSSNSEIWILGIGFKPTQEEVPSSIQNIVDINRLESIVYYGLFPFLELWGGTKSFLKMSAFEYKRFLLDLKYKVSLANVATAETKIEIQSALTNVIFSCLGIAAASSSSAIATVASGVLTAATVAFSTVNLGCFAADLITLEKYTKFELIPYNKPPTTPILFTPVNNATNVASPIIFSWSIPTYEEFYNIQISKFNDFSSLEWQESGISASQKQVNSLSKGTKYYWRVRSQNEYGVSDWSNVWTFTTPNESGYFTDPRDGNIYNWIKINTQTWMADNLAYLPSVNPSSMGSNTSPLYYVNGYQGTNASDAKAQSNYQIYGVLYNLPAAAGSCPAGWRLPTDAEWSILSTNLGGESVSGGKIKEAGISHWTFPNTGATNESDFNALPGGVRLVDGTFSGVGNSSYFWSSTPISSISCWGRDLFYNNSNFLRNDYNKNHGLSVRCIKD